MDRIGHNAVQRDTEVGHRKEGSEAWGWKGRHSTHLAGVIEGTQEGTGQRQNVRHNDG